MKNAVKSLGRTDRKFYTTILEGKTIVVIGAGIAIALYIIYGMNISLPSVGAVASAPAPVVEQVSTSVPNVEVVG